MSTCGCGGDSTRRPRHGQRPRPVAPAIAVIGHPSPARSAPARRCSRRRPSSAAEHRERGDALRAHVARARRAAPLGRRPPARGAGAARGPASPCAIVTVATCARSASGSCASERDRAGAGARARPTLGQRPTPRISGSRRRRRLAPLEHPARRASTTTTGPARRALAHGQRTQAAGARSVTRITHRRPGSSRSPSADATAGAPRPGARPRRCRRTSSGVAVGGCPRRATDLVDGHAAAPRGPRRGRRRAAATRPRATTDARGRDEDRRARSGRGAAGAAPARAVTATRRGPDRGGRSGVAARASDGGCGGATVTASLLEADEAQLGHEPDAGRRLDPVAAPRSTRSRTSAARAPGVGLDEVGVLLRDDRAADPQALAGRTASMSRPAASPGGLRNTEPAFAPPGWCSRRQRTISRDPRLAARRVVAAPPRSSARDHDVGRRRARSGGSRGRGRRPGARPGGPSPARSATAARTSTSRGLAPVPAGVHPHRAADRSGDADVELEPGAPGRRRPAGEHRQRRPRRPR